MRRRVEALFRVLTVVAACAATLAPAAAEAQRTTLSDIESTPPGATVYFDSVSEGQRIGQTPLRNQRLPRGSHVLIFQLEGHKEARLPIEVTRRRETYRATLEPFARVMITAGNAAATYAAVLVDGQPAGNIPYQGEVEPGRHQVEVRKEGFEPFAQWFELRPGQVLTLPVVLEASAPETGQILVASDVPGSEVLLDDQPRGTTPTLIENVRPGPHTVIVRPPGGAPEVREVVTVIAGQRVAVTAQSRRAAGGGTLRVLSSVPETIIDIDGEVIGQAPLTREGVPAGEHVVGAILPGYPRIEQIVTVVAGETKLVSFQMRPAETGPGAIVVRSDVPGAVVFVDGEERGAPPVVLEDVSDGTHAIIVRAPGHEDFRTTCRTGGTQTCELDVELEPIGTLVRVTANAPGAELFLDGQQVGPIPFEGYLPVGPARLEVRAPGHQPDVRQVVLELDEQPRTFDVQLLEEGVMSRAEQERLVRGMSTHTADPLLRDHSAIDIAVGWPYHLELRLGVGILDWLDVGFAIRTVIPRIVEFEGRAKAGVRPIKQFSIGAQVRVGGGIGPSHNEEDASGEVTQEHPTNNFFFITELLASLHFSANAAFTLFTAWDLHIDRWDFPADDFDPSRPENAVRDGSKAINRWRLGGTLEGVLSRNWNVFGTFEGIVLGPEAGRPILGDVWNGGNEDIELYFQLGTTYKF